MSRTNGPLTPLQAYSPTGFFKARNSALRVEFVKNASGEVTEAVVYQNGGKVAHPRTNEPLPKERATITIPNALSDTYVGNYEIRPGMVLNERREGNRFIGQIAGQPAVEMLATAENVFFAKEAGAQIAFEKAADGTLSHMVLTQGGRETKAKKIP